MARGFVVRAFVDELPLKIVSLVIAITLFVVVRTDREASTGVYVKVIYTLPSDRVLVSDPISEVRVGVRGSWTRLARLEDRGIEPIRVDLKDVRDGALRFEDAMIKLPAGLRVASISPAEVQLKFEARAMREVAVEAVLEGQPADGFQLGVVSATPRTVRIEGPRSVVKGLSRIRTRPVGVKGARDTVEADVELEAEPPHCRYLDVAQVAVRADIQPSIVERTFAMVPVRVLGMAKLAGAAEPAVAKVILRGPAARVTALTADQLDLVIDGQLADTRPPARYLRRLTVSGLPAGVGAEVQPDAVELVTRRR